MRKAILAKAQTTKIVLLINGSLFPVVLPCFLIPPSHPTAILFIFVTSQSVANLKGVLGGGSLYEEGTRPGHVKFHVRTLF